MKKIIAILSVISWSGFWVFGYLALSSDGQDQGLGIVYALLAAAGFLIGAFAYMRLCCDRPVTYHRVEQG